MKSKKILVILSRTPFEGNSIKETFRTALGMTAGYLEHKVDLLLTKDAVFFLKQEKDKDMIDKFVKTFFLLDSKIHIDKDSLEEKGLKGDELDLKDPFVLTEREDILKLLQDSEITLCL